MHVLRSRTLHHSTRAAAATSLTLEEEVFDVPDVGSSDIYKELMFPLNSKS